MDHSEDAAATAHFFDRAISELARLENPPRVRVLDFGCGSGELVQHLVELGYDAHGCDIVPAPEAPTVAPARQRLKEINRAPYRFPFDDESFDVVVSTSVLEHARNPDEYLMEIRRVLKPGGFAMHLLPGKWYLPYEPHILVPLANYFYPTRQHERHSLAVFGNCEWPMEFYIMHGHGGFARLCRKLPMRKLWGILSREFRMGFLVQRKQSA